MKIIRSLGAIALASVIAATASAEERGYSAVLCSANPSTSNIMRTFWGVETTNLSPATVFCGAAPPVGADVNRIQATVFDRNPSDDLCCWMYVADAAGYIVTSAQRCSSGNSNASQLLSVIPPVNVAGTVLLVCDIPAAQPTGVSRIGTYRVRTTQ